MLPTGSFTVSPGGCAVLFFPVEKEDIDVLHLSRVEAERVEANNGRVKV